MIVSEAIINTLLREIDMLYIEGQLSVSDAEDLSTCVSWIIGKSLNESNVQYVINNLRGFKSVMDVTVVSRVINSFRSTLGGYLV